ncbi:MAG: PBP1A family penicillin-binding protein [Oscillospiraceae bacterium]|nr:PBP1A family penicillin-binding protein [Oscillospiraceae bacterium]
MSTAYSGGASAPCSRKSDGGKTAVHSLGIVLKVLGTVLLVGLCTCVIMGCYAVIYVQNQILPQVEQTLSAISVLDVNESSTMYYTDSDTGELVELLTLYGDENRVWVEYEDIPENLIYATVAIEDQRFWNHSGVDWIRTAKAILLMFTGGDIQGGSTITQQLLKNITSNNEVTVQRKVLEIFMALEFEKTHTKEEILEWYLNYIYLGDSCYGVYTASLNYFGKELDELTLAECASLISITNNPSAYNPYRHPENNLTRRNLVLSQIEAQGLITEEEMLEAQAEELTLNRETASAEQVVFSWYEDQVIEDVIADLMSEYDLSETAATNLLYRGGLQIETCLDPEVQAYVDEVYTAESIGSDSTNGHTLQSAITVIDNSTGNVVALAGGIGEKKGSRLYNRATQAVRPSGSSIKPLSVYAPALDLGLVTPYSVVDDTPILVDGSAWPRNSGGYYNGLVTVSEAVRRSLNTVAVKVLQDYVTIENSYEYLTEHFGITTLVESREVNGSVKTDLTLASLALGGLTDGVSTYEMAAAYATFANNGIYKAPRIYSRVVLVDSNGKETVLLDNTSASEAVLKESTVYYINQMLKSVVSSGTGTTASFSGMTIAGKTGTTTSNYDRWFAGYTPYYTAVVWIGYDTQEKIPSANSNMAMTLWKEVMQPLHAELENIDFETPDGLVTAQYCQDSGLLATEWCTSDIRGSRVATGTYVSGTQPTTYCTVHTSAEVCTESPVLDSNGNETGLYHLCSEYCPEECRLTVGVVDYDRYYATSSVTASDDIYLLSYLEEQGVCTLHTEETVETDDPDASDEPNTSDEPAVSESPTVSEEPVVSKEPATSEEPAASEEPETTDDPETTEDPDAADTDE